MEIVTKNHIRLNLTSPMKFHTSIMMVSLIAQQVRNLLQCKRLRRRGFIPGLGRSYGGVNGNPLQYCCLENPMDRGAWQAI